jgi:heme/copper-type cytochrome/quinol oxidase subunit 2
MPVPHPTRFVLLVTILVPALGMLALWQSSETPSAATSALLQESTQEFTIVARKYGFIPPRIEVRQDDLVKVTLRTEDIPHSFTIDDYRIAKRVNPGQTVVFEFRADQAGRFPFYCSLTIDEGCKEMHGELVVRPR